ncbi:carotenoid ester lipase precursor [Irpex rosettiformis]|uniref:Carotenoid ester lipase n=1 Tax=Irpex rosettiformis TaxID=378272 RepID=A0ACB8UAJ0_9APHY|nr:carotenoid ester lipase precursor [Irpex rosettiformis]
MLGYTARLWVAALAASTTSVAFAQSTTADSTGGNPQIRLDRGTFIGVRNGSIDRFLGIPFAKPPLGGLRFSLPVAPDRYTGQHNATEFGPACHQQALSFTIPDNLDPQAKAIVENGFGSFPHVSEDCLTVNVYKPSNFPPNSLKKLPVVIWIYGGGFEVGGSSSYDGAVIVQRSIDLGEPIIYVSMNYRCSLEQIYDTAYGFLNGAEVKADGVANLGLQDQREAFRWVQRYIGAFGGDRFRVTIWGQSAGSISVGLQMVANGGNTEGLFHAAFMESGSPISVGDTLKGQKWYDFMVEQLGCVGSDDTLTCLRDTVSAADIDAAQNLTPAVTNRESLNITWVPRVDGKFLRDVPYHAVLEGRIANIPFVSGNTDDEGTLFSLQLGNITTDEDVHAYISSNYFPDATAAEIDDLLELYPDDVTLGSPFDTGNANVIAPQFKRLAAIQGDYLFQAPRRFLLQNRADRQPAWSYLSKRSKSLPDLGSFHTTDLFIIYTPGDLTDNLVHFVNYHNPNSRGDASWPRYTRTNPMLLTLLDGSTPTVLEKDNYRADAMNYMNELLVAYPS